MKVLSTLALWVLCTVVLHAQQVQPIGLIRNTAQSFNGYTLFAPADYTTTYLIDNCGRAVKTWQSQYVPGQSAYLLEDGSLFRTANPRTNRTFSNTGGAGGRVERYDWNGALQWGYDWSGTTFYQHHDAVVLPNGNVLLLSWDTRTREEAVAAGRKTSLYPMNGLWSDKIVELKPIGKDSAVVVWEWRVWDHLVQDNDASKANFGVVAERPERLDVNFTNKTAVVSDWIHFNGLAYNAELDQIIVSSRELSEIYIIDHSTTTAEAASSKGGRQGKGGDFLWRWGNPAAYKRGTSTDRKLFGQHNPQWIAKGSPGAGNVLVFNNGDERPDGNYSTIEELQTPVSANGSYTAPASSNATFLPVGSVWTYKASPATSFFANRISGTQRLPNGNTLICEGTKGNFFEVTPTGANVWQYRNPVGTAGPTAQGSSVSGQNVFRCVRYAPDYAAFQGKTLPVGAPIELNPTANTCTITGITENATGSIHDGTMRVAPNPASDPSSITVYFSLSHPQRVRLSLHDMLGREVLVLLDTEMAGGENTVSLSALNTSLSSGMLSSTVLPSGVYRLHLKYGAESQSVLLRIVR